MPFSLEWEPSGVVRRFYGDVTLAERYRSLEAICGDIRFDDLRFTITNYLDVGAYQDSPRDTEEIAAYHIAPLMTNPQIVIAGVAVRGDIVDLIKRFRAFKLTTQPYEVFSTEAAARMWIGAMGRGRPATSVPQSISAGQVVVLREPVQDLLRPD